VATKLPGALTLAPLGSEPRELDEWLTTFHLASVVLDPYTNESSWVLKSAVRILEGLRGSDARVNFVVTSDADDARRFLGPLSEDFQVFCDPDRAVVKAMGLERLGCRLSCSSGSTASSSPRPRVGTRLRGAVLPSSSPRRPRGACP
jgi:hypothetical protein